MIVGTSYTGGTVAQCVIVSASLLDLLLSRHSGETLHRETHDLRHGLHRSHWIVHVKRREVLGQSLERRHFRHLPLTSLTDVSGVEVLSTSSASL